MKNLSIFSRLQTQYNKLNQLLQTKGSQFSQFKQQQVLNRMNRCGLQLKRLGMGMSVCLALGVGTPVMGQTPRFIDHIGNANPFDNIPNQGYKSVFVDLDGDADYDIFQCEVIGGVNYHFHVAYYENTGTPTTPSYVLQSGANNPMNSMTDLGSLAFVDVDNDGDLDCLAGAYYRYDNSTLHFYENTGTSSAPVFVEQTGSSNPFDVIKTTLGAIGNFSSKRTILPSFVDIDQDGDIDCFTGTFIQTSSPFSNAADIMYFENTGSAASGVFVQQTGTNNPFNGISSTLLGYVYLSFEDFDNNGLEDVFINTDFLNGNKLEYYQNVGSSGAPIFLLNSVTPLDSIPSIHTKPNIAFVDIDADSDIDVLSKFSNNSIFYENLDTTVVSNVSFVGSETSISIYPNPTTGILNFERSITGNASLFNITGQKVWDKELYDKQTINLSELDNGIYFLTIETAKERIRTKILIQK